jgi:hypothetical protein
VAVSIAAVATAAQEETARPLDVVPVGLGQHHAGVIEVRLHPIGVDQHIRTVYAQPSVSGLVPVQHLRLYLSL